VAQPSSIAAFYHTSSDRKVPIIAVAAGSSVWMHRMNKPYWQLDLPPLTLEEAEKAPWDSFKGGEITSEMLKTELKDLRDRGINLTRNSIDILSIEDAKKLGEFAEKCKETYQNQTTCVTCMCTLYEDIEQENAISMLVVCTESKNVHIVEPKQFKIIKTILLPAVPIVARAKGTYNGEHRIIVACRDATVYTIKKATLTGRVIEMETQIVDMRIIDKDIIIATMNCSMHSYGFKGKINYSIYFPAPVTNLCEMRLTKMRNFEGIIVGLGNGEIRLYNKRDLISTIKCKTAITGLIFGPFGREAGALLIAHRNRALSVKMLRRQAKLELDPEEKKSQERKESQNPLDVPQKTKLFVEQMKREQDQPVEMHRKFQRDLCKLRLATAQAYVKIIQHGQGPLSTAGHVPLHLDAQVHGLGPCFKIKLTLRNNGNKALYNIPLTTVYDEKLYRIDRPMFKAASIVPGLDYQYDIDVIAIDENGASAPIKIYICNTKSCVPILSANVQMPISELIDEEDR